MDENAYNYIYDVRGCKLRTGDTTIARWMCIDPLAEKYYDVSPYAYCKNNPVKYIDFDGRKIVISGTCEQQMETLRILQTLTNNNLRINYKTGEVTLYGNIRWDNRDKHLSVGTGLIRDLISNENTASIIINNDEDTFARDVYRRDAFNGKGTDVKVFFDSNYTPYLQTTDNGGNVTTEKVLPKIALGHELIHSIRSMNGEAQRDEITGNYEYKTSYGYYIQTSEELETIGIKGNYKYTENKFRHEHDLNRRIKY